MPIMLRQKVTEQGNILRSLVQHHRNLLSDHVGPPKVVIVAVHLVTQSGWAEGIILRHFY